MITLDYKRPDLMARLLQHGPLTSHQVLQITGWTRKNMDHALQGLRHQGEVRLVNIRGYRHWRLTGNARFPEIR